ncbi:hypothetical protein CVT24_000392 [Panaeolus cyanescens]|uniref:DUF6589 domain-containing protein n=1 Tax=Panaeolus cyanescens TaxID=181874 RepID=A0A409YDK8_9AGAR|nr:hypothetical protein CVT24_000392 [Panaeolus cyanescens]
MLQELDEERIFEGVVRTIQTMRENGINLPIFLDAISWGLKRPTQDSICRYQRTALLHYKNLSAILERWQHPLRSASGVKRPAGASKTMVDFAIHTTSTQISKELKKISPIFRLKTGDDVDAKKKTEIVLKLLAIYMKFRGVSANGFDTLHALGLTMSHKWACDIVGRLSEQAMEEITDWIEKTGPGFCLTTILTSHSVSLPQRFDHNGGLGHGTVAPVYIKPQQTNLPEATNDKLKESRAERMKKPLTAADIMLLNDKSYPHIHRAMQYQVLRHGMLLESEDFDLGTYHDRDSPALKRPPFINQLSTENKTLQYLLGTVNIPEVSYDDSKLVGEWLNQLRFRGTGKRRELSAEKMMPLQGRGLLQAFEALKRKGLSTTRTQGLFHHGLVEALYHIAEAHVRVKWYQVGNVTSLRELRNKTGEELRNLANKIVDQEESSEPLDWMDQNEQQTDEQKRLVIMFIRDVLQFIVLDRAIKDGDGGMMETLLPSLLFRFPRGGGGVTASTPTGFWSCYRG